MSPSNQEQFHLTNVPDGRPSRLESRGRGQTIRKLVHISSVFVPILVWFLPREYSLLLAGGGLAAALAVEWARARVRWVRLEFLRRTRRLLKPHERRRFSGATYMAAGYFLAALLFPRPIAVAAMLYNTLGDSTASLVGRRWGRHRVAWGRSWEGFCAGLAMNLAIGMTIPGIGVMAAVVGAAVAAMIEFAPIPIDDNLRIPLAGGLALWATGI